MRFIRFVAVFILVFTLSELSQSQQFFFHLLAVNPIANFTVTSQTVAEGSGTWSGWPVGLKDWSRRRELAVHGVTTSLANYPVLLKLDVTRVDYSAVQDLGQDLRFTDQSGNLLPHEIERWDESGTSIVWVKVSSLAAYPAYTKIWMYYGNNAAADGQSGTAVWDASHLGVWHLGVGASVGSDATTNANHGTVTGAVPATGVGGQGMSFAGGTDRITLPDTLISNKTVMTLEGWFKTTATDVPLFGWATVAYPGAQGSYVPVMHVTSDGKFKAEQWIGAQAPITTAGVMNDGNWHYAVLVVNSPSQSLYVDGVLVGTLPGAITTFASSRTYLGAAFTTSWTPTAGGWRSFNGTLDEFRLSTVARSTDWIQANYLAMNDGLITYQPEETPLSGAAVMTVLLNQVPSQQVTVPYTISGTATSMVDHDLANGTVVIPAGSVSATIRLRPLRDDLVETGETAVVTLGAPTEATLGTDIVHTVTITDEALIAPDAIDDSFNVTSLSAQTISVLSNDTDANNDLLSITAVGAPTWGTAVRVGRSILYTPNGDFGGTDSFTYTVSDGRGGTDTATVNLAYQIPFTWLGSGADANWSTTANWLGGAVPGAGDIAYFNDQCTTYCNPQIDVAANVLGARFNSTFAGAVVQGAGQTLTVGASGYLQRAGTFTGTTGAISIDGPFNLLGGTVTSTAGVLSVSDAFTKSGGTFNHNNGELKFERFTSLGTTNINITGALTAYDLRFAGGQNSGATAHTWNLASGTLTVDNQLRIGRTATASTSAVYVNGGTITLNGNLVLDPNVSGAGTTSVVMAGSGDQTYSAPAFGGVPRLTINKATGAVNPFDGTDNSFAAESFTLTAGTFNAPSGTLTVNQGFSVAVGSTFNHNSGNLIFDNAGKGTPGGSSAVTVPTTLSLNNLSVAGGWPASAANYSWTLSGNLNVAGTFSQGRTTGTGLISLNGGTLDLLGGVAISAGSGGGTTLLTVNSGSAQALSQVAATSVPGAVVTVNKVASTLTQGSAVALSTVGQSLNLTSGIYNMAGFNLAVNSTVTVGASARLICNGGVLTYGSAVVNGEVSCGPTIGITWTGLAGDGLWSTAGNWTNNTVPGASDIAIFGTMCTGVACNVATTGATSVKGIILQSGYTGTFTQSAGHTLTVGTSGWTQAGGTFAGGNSAITIGASISLTGGTFTSTSGTLQVLTNWTSVGATFNHNSGTVAFYGDVTATINAGAAVFSSLNVTKATSGSRSVAVTGTLQTGNLSLTNTGVTLSIDTGIIDVTGNLTVSGAGKAGTGSIRLSGASNQTITASSSIPRLTINKSGGTATFAGTLQIYYDLTYTAGTVDFGTSIIEIVGDANTTLNVGTLTTLNEFRFSKATSAVRTTTITGTLKTNTVRFSHTGFGAQLNGGHIEIYGDAFFNHTVYLAGSSILKVLGSGNQTLTGIATAALPDVEISSTGGIVTFAGTLSFIRNFTYYSGVVDTGTSMVNFGYAGYYTGLSFAINAGPIDFYNVTFRGTQNGYNLTGTLSVNGALVLGDQSSSLGYINTGTILAKGNVSTNSYGYAGSALLQVAGSVDQTLTGISTSPFLETEIVSTGGTVNLSGTVVFARGLKYSAGTVSAGVSTVQIGYSWWNSATTYIIDTGSVVFNNLVLSGTNRTFTLNSDINVNGTLTLGDLAAAGGKAINGSKILVAGNIVFNNYGFTGTTELEMNGAATSTLTIGSTAAKMSGAVIVNKTGAASARLIQNTSYSSAGQDVTVTAGVLDLDGYDLTVQDVLTVSAGAELRCSGGAIAFATLAGTGTVNCAGYGGFKYNWTGAGGDANWNTGANWSGGAAPGSTDIPIFSDAFCGATCNVTVNIDPNIRGLWVVAPYTGTITQSAGVAINIGRGGWRHPAGTFVGSNSNITVGKSLLVTGGTFTSTTATLTIYKNAAAEGGPTNDTVFDIAGGTFTPNGGTLRFNELNASATSYTHRINIPGGLDVANVIFNAEGAGTGTTTWQVNAAQTLRALTSFSIGRASGTANVALSASTLEIQGSASYNAGTNGGTLTQTNLTSSSAQTITVNAAAVMPSGAYAITGNGGYTLSGNLRSTGVLTLGNTSSTGVTLSGGTLEAQGNVVVSNFGYSGTTALSFTGTSATTLNIAAGAALMNGTVTLNKTGAGAVTLASAASFSGAGQDLTLTSGTFNTAGFNLAVQDTLSIAVSAALYCSGGTLTYGTLSALGTIDCSGESQRRVYSYTGANQTFTVPAGVTSIAIKIWGGGGGGTPGGSGYGAGQASTGGGAGYVTATLAVTPGQVLTLIVGGGGLAGGSAGADTFGGGGRRNTFSGAGGGRSAIRNAVAVELITAAGGGGGGSANSAGQNNNTAGGAGGGATGLNGASVTYPAIVGKGGTQVAGGAAGVGVTTAVAGTQYLGGRALADYVGGGGGGGYYGGGGGDYIGSTVVAGGGGGSSYIGGAGVSAASTTAGSGATQGNSADPVTAGAGGVAGAAGANGRILITW